MQIFQVSDISYALRMWSFVTGCAGGNASEAPGRISLFDCCKGVEFGVRLDILDLFIR